MNDTLGHVERANRFIARPRLERRSDGTLGWRPDYKSRAAVAGDVAYGQITDVVVKGSVTVVSAALLMQAEAPLTKILFGVTTVVLGAITLASLFEAV